MHHGVKPALKAIEGGLAGVPSPPAGLPAGTSAEWNTIAADLVERRLLTASMLGLLETYVTALWTVRQARAALAQDGIMVRTVGGSLKPHPAAGLLSKAQDAVARLGGEMGLTPAARSRKGLQAKPEGDDDGAPPHLAV